MPYVISVSSNNWDDRKQSKILAKLEKFGTLDCSSEESGEGAIRFFENGVGFDTVLWLSVSEKEVNAGIEEIKKMHSDLNIEIN